MKSNAKAVWQGGLRDGKGTISTGSGALNDLPYTFATRFEGAKGTNPEELIGASHAGCFSMALAAELGKASLTPQSVETSAVVTLEKVGDGFSVTQSALTTVVIIPGADKGLVESAAASAKENCPISKLLNTKITLDLTVNT